MMRRLLLPRRPLRTRFVLGLGMMLLPLVVLAVGALFSLHGVISAFDEVVEAASAELSLVLRLEHLLLQARVVARDHFIPGFGEQDGRERFNELSRQVEKGFQEAMSGGFDLETERELIRSAHAEWKRGRSAGEAILAIPNSAPHATAPRALERLDAHLDRAMEILERLQNLCLLEMARHFERAQGVRRRALVAIPTVVAMGLGAAILIGMSLARSILLPLRALGEAAGRFGSGELSHRVALASEDELGQVGETFNAMADRLAKIQAELEDLSIHDGLTGLYNFREFHRQLAEEAQRSRRYGHAFSLLMLDIDEFKAVNDTFGHLAGDEALRALAALLRREVRPVDRLARYGGDEMAIILPETPGPGALTVADRIRDRIATHPIPLAPAGTVSLTVSIGVATYPEQADSAERLIGAADQALYAAKQAGRNRVCRVQKA